ncbi:hypothetical protein OSJ57_00060 [Sphingomonas sp. HH69]
MQIIVSDNALKEGDVRNFRASRHRSPRLHRTKAIRRALGHLDGYAGVVAGGVGLDGGAGG